MNHGCKIWNSVFYNTCMGSFLSVSFYECQVKCFRLPDGSLMKITKVYALDAVFDNPEDVPEDVSKSVTISLRMLNMVEYACHNCCCGSTQIKANKRYAGSSNWTVQVCSLLFTFLGCMCKSISGG